MEEISKRFSKYINITERALKQVKLKNSESICLNLKDVAKDFLDMAERYYQDAKYFKQKGDIITAFAAINYSHAFLDAGARLGLFDVKNSELFASD